MDDNAQHIAKRLRAIILAVALFLAAASGDSFGQHPTSPPQTAPVAPPATISAAEVIAKSAEVSNLLNIISSKFDTNAEIEKIQESLPRTTRQIDLDYTDTLVTLGEQPPLTAIQAEQARWQQRHQQVNARLALLTRRAVELRAAHETLSHTATAWEQTREAAQAEQAPPAILQQVVATLAAIGAAQAQLKSQEDSVLGLQSSLAAELSRCDDILAQLARAQKLAVAGMLSRENPPIWSHELWSRASGVLSERLSGIAWGFWANIREYLSDPSRGLVVFAALFMGLTLATAAGRCRKRQWAASGIGVAPTVAVFDQPFSAALMVVLWAASSPASAAPARVKDLLLALAFVPVIRLVRRMVDPRVPPIIYAVVILYMVDLLRRALGGVPLVEQALLFLESAAVAAALGWLLHRDRLRHIPGQVPPILRTRFGPALLKLLLAGLFVGGLTAVLGFTRLARMVTPAILNGAALALILLAALRVWPLDRLQMVRKHIDLLENWTQRPFFWAAVFIWFRRI